jgi:hypothetical protein
LYVFDLLPAVIEGARALERSNGAQPHVEIGLPCGHTSASVRQREQTTR